MNYNPYSLESKTILITGASSGIGKATAIECAKLGARCIISGRDEERLKNTCAQLHGNGHQIVIGDLTQEDTIKRIVSVIPQLDGVVFNAGINKTAPIYFLKQNEIENVFGVNTIAPMLLMNALLKSRLVKNGASVVFTSSIDSVVPAITTASYGASKAALTNFMKLCAKELAPRKIRSNAVHPGMVETTIIREMHMTDEEYVKDKQDYLLKRYGRPEEIAWAIVYLLSDASLWVTGSVLTIDGGYSIR